MDHNRPLDTRRDGALKAVIWENRNDKGDTYHTVNLARTYEDRDGRLKDSHSFTTSDLLRIAKLADKAHDVIVARRRELSLQQENRHDQLNVQTVDHDPEMSR